MEEIEAWVARDQDGEIAMYENKPFKDKRAEQWTCGGRYTLLHDNWLPEVKWSNEEPTKVKIVIDK